MSNNFNSILTLWMYLSLSVNMHQSYRFQMNVKLFVEIWVSSESLESFNWLSLTSELASAVQMFSFLALVGTNPHRPHLSTGPTSQSAWQQQHRSIILSKMAVAPVTSSRTHSHATQLFWILNIIIVTIITLLYYPKNPKIWLLQKSKSNHFWPLWSLAFSQRK